MKIKSTTIVLLAILCAVTFQQASAQDNCKPQVKILPANQHGFIKIMYLGDNVSDVEVKFYNDKGLYTIDNVARSSFDKGFLKKYDVRHVRPGESFWIEVNGATVTANYKMTPDQNGYVASLERMQVGPVVTAFKD